MCVCSVTDFCLAQLIHCSFLVPAGTDGSSPHVPEWEQTVGAYRKRMEGLCISVVMRDCFRVYIDVKAALEAGLLLI